MSDATPVFPQPFLGPHWAWLIPPKPKRELTDEDRALHRAIAAIEAAMSPARR